MDGPFDELRKRAKTFAANIRGRPAEPNDFLPIFELNIEDVLPAWEQPSQPASHSPCPAETGEQTYQRLHNTGNVFDRAAAAPTQYMLDEQRNSFFLSTNPEETKKQMFAEAEAVANRRRAQAQDAHKTFVPHFKQVNLIPKRETKAEKDKAYESGRQLRPETQEPHEEHLPRPRSATVPTFKPQHPYHSPFYPEMDAEDIKHTTVREVGMGHGGPVGSGILMPLKKLDPISTLSRHDTPTLSGKIHLLQLQVPLLQGSARRVSLISTHVSREMGNWRISSLPIYLCLKLHTETTRAPCQRLNHTFPRQAASRVTWRQLTKWLTQWILTRLLRARNRSHSVYHAHQSAVRARPPQTPHRMSLIVVAQAVPKKTPIEHQP